MSTSSLKSTFALLSCTLAIATGCHHTGTASPAASTVTTGQVPLTESSSGGASADVFIGHINAATLGIPIYPGAKPAKGGGAVATTGVGGSNQVVFLTTPDSYEAVIAWYKSRLPYDGDPVDLGVLATASFRVGAKDAAQPKFATVTRLKGQTSIALSSGHAATATASGAGESSNAKGSSLADLSALGLPIYPSVYASEWAGNLSNDTEGTRLGQMSTHDSFAKVYEWYKQKMPAGSESAEQASSNHTNNDGEHGAIFQIGADSDPKFRRVMITQSTPNDETTISLAEHTTK